MENILAFVVVAVIIWWAVWPIIKNLYRRIFFKKLVEKNTSGSFSPNVKALSSAIQANDTSAFKSLAASASVDELVDALRDSKDGNPAKQRTDATTANVFESYANDKPNDAVAQMLRGRSLVDKAWDARGSAAGSTVTQEGWDGFSQHLAQAEGVLDKSISLDKNIPRTHAELLTVLRGTGNMNKLHQSFRDAKNQFPTSFPVHQQMIMALAQRWTGVDGKTLDFARSNSGSDSSNRLQWLVAAAHLDTAIFEIEEKPSIYFRNKEVRAEIDEAFKKYLTVESNDRDYLEGMHYFAATFFAMMDKRKAKKSFKKLKNFYSPIAWSSWGDSKEMFVRAKHWTT